MSYKVRLGLIVDNWILETEEKLKRGKASKRERQLLAKFARVTKYLSNDPFYHRLNTHEITTLTKRFGSKVYSSYMEHKTPRAYRAIWAFGPNDGDLTVLNVIPHPQNNREYGQIPLSDYPED